MENISDSKRRGHRELDNQSVDINEFDSAENNRLLFNLYWVKFFEFDEKIHRKPAKSKHFHTFYEIMFLESGSLTYEVNKEIEISGGQFVIFGPGCEHQMMKYSSNYRLYTVAIDITHTGSDKSFITPECGYYVGKYDEDCIFPIKYALKYAHSGLVHKGNIVQTQIESLIWVLHDRVNEKIEETETDNQNSKTWNRNDKDLFENVKSYIIENLNKNITLCEMAEHLFISERHLNRRLLCFTGKTYGEIRDTLKCSIAKKMLFEDSSIAAISEKLGMTEGNFNRFFKRVEGMTPAIFRKSFIQAAL